MRPVCEARDDGQPCGRGATLRVLGSAPKGGVRRQTFTCTNSTHISDAVLWLTGSGSELVMIKPV